ncbi:FAD-binding oxidoreductase [Pseudovibrio sp. Tun.PSC04-5.I4]|uniref:NAD(P)/FAD-dependent oxidoreductase n=1 Tax=Pseudovibrio sp. Tun.PSC04-5.I4 TaxID=1798213 RepID=UPI00088015E4|nr:FAD-binding oxidoreductase [Pseudovibrio sp. Tun.PSC04-5.I4]SDQ90124.1 Glycine/D-amino acid oxidase [Pseudovibrio sp. Tun.PSC04-5.I4]
MATYTSSTPQQFFGQLPEQTDVLIIGGGVIGTCTAYWLAQKGVSVTLCEKGRVAGEQSSRNWGWIRQQGRDAAELPITMESNRLWKQLTEETGEDLGFRQQGVYFLAENEEELKSYEAFLEIAKQHQLDTELLSAEEVYAQIPGRKGKWVGGMVTPSDGRAEPWVAVPAIGRAAERNGATIVEECAVRTLEFEGGKLTGAVTEKGTIKANRVLIAAGAWSSLFAQNLGVSMPQLCVRATVAATQVAPDIFKGDAADGTFAFRKREDGGFTLAVSDIHDHYIGKDSFRHLAKWLPAVKASFKGISFGLNPPKNYPDSWAHRRSWTGDEVTPFEKCRVLNPAPNPRAIKRIQERLYDRFPQLRGLKFEETWAGMIDAMPDFVPIMDEVPTQQGVFIATGFSGHGFGIGPAAGRIMADMLMGKPAGYDLTRFRYSRFSDGSKIELGPFI